MAALLVFAVTVPAIWFVPFRQRIRVAATVFAGCGLLFLLAAVVDSMSGPAVIGIGLVALGVVFAAGHKAGIIPAPSDPRDEINDDPLRGTAEIVTGPGAGTKGTLELIGDQFRFMADNGHYLIYAELDELVDLRFPRLGPTMKFTLRGQTYRIRALPDNGLDPEEPSARRQLWRHAIAAHVATAAPHSLPKRQRR